MQANKSDQKKNKSFDPDSAFEMMSKLLTQIQDLTVTNKKEADNQKQELSKKISKLSKSVVDFYKGKKVKSKKKGKESK